MKTCTECQGPLNEYTGECEACCEHDFDVDEGYMCLNCGAQGDYGDLIDDAYDRWKDEEADRLAEEKEED